MLTLVHLIERDDVTVGACLHSDIADTWRYMTLREAREVVDVPEIPGVETINYLNLDLNSSNSSYALMEMLGMVKTMDGWNASKQDLSGYLKVGDFVDDEIFDYFLCVLPPEYWTGDILQMGEHASHREWGPTYATLKRHGGGWVYCGNCYRGQTAHIR